MLTHRTKDKYYTNGYSVFCNDVEVIRSYVGDELKVLQGMDRMGTIKKTNNDCPEIIERNNWDLNRYPYVFSS